jgi:cytoskeletal protein RodZ
VEITELQKDQFFEELKRVRESKGIRLEEISRRYKIRQSFLESIESGSFEDLPEPVYTKTFVKTYADLLGVDSGPILARYANYMERTLSAAMPDAQKEQAGQPSSEKALFDLLGRQGSKIGWAVLAAAVVIILGIWVFQDRADRPTPVKAVVTETPKPPEKPPETPPALQAPAPPQEAAPPQQTTAEAPAAPTQTAAAQPTPEPRKPEAQPAAAPVAAAAVPAALSLKIEATEAAWVQVKADKMPPVQKLMQAGETLTAEAKERITVDLGNAGGVQITFQEQSLGSPGKRGEVMHLVYPEGKRIERKKPEEPKPSVQLETE